MTQLLRTDRRVRSERQSSTAGLSVVLTGTFMVVLDFFIVNVALPSMQGELHASAGAIEWVVAGYGLTSAVFLITAARLGDRIGRRRAFWLGLGLFTLASAACGLAAGPEVLVGARLVQGVGGALIMPNVLAIIGAAYAGAERGRALGAYGLVMGLAAASGQLIGGALVQAVGWRACFLINVPVGAVALGLAPRLVPETRAALASRLDVLGTTLVTAGLTAVVLPLVEGRQHGWPLWTWLSFAAAPVLLGGFAVHQRALGRRGGAPLLAPALLRARSFTAGLVTQLAFWCGQASFFLVLALYLQRGRGLSALGAGLLFTVLAVLVPALVLIGAGMGLVIVPLTTTIMSGVDAEHAGAASGALSTMQSVGAALGVAVTGVIFFGALGGGYAHALELSLAQLAALLVGVAALTRRLPAVR
jgi:MFS family permease